MKKLMAVFQIAQLALACVAFVLGLMLFQKREILKGRTVKLERALTMLSATLETGACPTSAPLSLPARDIGPINRDSTDTPGKSDFWSRYRTELEKPLPETMDLADHLLQLRTYYRVDPITLEAMRDPATGEKLTDGPGTMQEAIDDVVAHALGQLDRLNKTRTELRKTREELVDTVSDLNGRKQEIRVAMRTIGEREQTIAGLEQTVTERQTRIQDLEQNLAETQDTIRDLEHDVALKEETITDLNDTVAVLNRRITSQEPIPQTPVVANFSPGNKGRVTTANNEWCFVLLSLSDEFLAQYQAAREQSRNDPQPEFMLFRSGDGRDEFVTKVRLCSVDPETRTGVADIMADWQQLVVVPGDTALY